MTDDANNSNNSNADVDVGTNEEFLDALDEVHTRFLLNLPPEELTTADRIFFQLEQAWWFYEDMICDQRCSNSNNNNSNNNVDDAGRPREGQLPRFSNLKPFAKFLFEYSPLLTDTDFYPMYRDFTEYRSKISTYGCILLNSDLTHVVLCQVWRGDVWTLPAGKINQGETGVQAASRETYEETGFDPHCMFGLTREWLENNTNTNNNNNNTTATNLITWTYPLDEEKNGIVILDTNKNGKNRTCYVCWGVPMDFPFLPVARKEVECVEWFPLDDLPKKSFAVLPFMGKLRHWIRKKQQQQQNTSNTGTHRTKSRNKSSSTGRDKSSGRDKSNGRDHSNKKGSKGTSNRQQHRGTSVQQTNDPLVDCGLANVGDSNRWSEEDMFLVNEQLSGKKVLYDGNPHVFAEEGFHGGVDPHSFRVVGGSFMNTTTTNPSTNTATTMPLFSSTSADEVATPRNLLSDLTTSLSISDQQQQRQKYQPLVYGGGSGSGSGRNTTIHNHRTDESDGGLVVVGLQPFFSQRGVTPWGDVETEARSATTTTATTPNNKNHTKKNNNNSNKKKNPPHAASAAAASTTTTTKREIDQSKQLLAMLHSSSAGTGTQEQQEPPSSLVGVASSSIKANTNDDTIDCVDDDHDDEFDTLDVLTDRQITARKQAQYHREHRLVQQYEADKACVERWVRQLPNPTGFTLQNIDAIIRKHFGEAY